MTNPYIPYQVTASEIIIENEACDLKTFKLTFNNKEDAEAFSYTPGQFAMVSLFGRGESPFGIASSPTEEGYIMFTVKKVGSVTKDLHEIEEGTVLGLRGPLGNYYPLERMEGKNVVIVGGGFAFTTLRSTLIYMLDPANRSKYKDITVIYGARSPGELMYKDTLKAWEDSSDLDMIITVDKGDDQWKGREGFVPPLVGEVAPSSENTLALVCGPPIMIQFTIPELKKLGFAPENIILSLEMRMKCGIGKCGRCNIGAEYVCIDGPVFTLSELSRLPDEF